MDGSGYRELKVGEGLAAVALTDDLLLWMTVGGNGSDSMIVNSALTSA